MSFLIRVVSGVASMMAGMGSCQAPKSWRKRAPVSPSSVPPAVAFHVAYQMIRSPVAGPRPKRAPRPQVSVPSLGSGTDPAGVSDRSAYSSALESEILLLDDLGAQRVTAWVEDTVNSIITYRCNHRRTLIATTNLYDQDAGDTREREDSRSKYFLDERIGMRARSRLFEMCRVIRIPEVGDYRVRTMKTLVS